MQGIISFLPKGNKPRQLLKNWWQITFLNVHVLYKILLGGLSHRIKQVLNHIVSDIYTVWFSNGWIYRREYSIYDIMAYTERNNTPDFLILNDFKKGF